MRLAIMQPYFFPYLNYFQLLDAADVFVVFDDVNFINRGWINRNYILLNHNKHLFTVPLVKATQNRMIKDIEVADQTKWRPKFLKILGHAYSRAPEFQNVFPGIESLVHNPQTMISVLAAASIEFVKDQMDMKTKILFSSKLGYDRGTSGHEKIIEICQLLNAEVYINPIGGIDLYSSDVFIDNGIELRFLRAQDYRYRQFKEKDFIPNLSIIDALMFNSKEELSGLLKQYTLDAA